MVEQTARMNSIFGSLADTTRRDILRRVGEAELSISALAKSYKLSFAAIAKHVRIMEEAGLVNKRKVGREQLISANPKTVHFAIKYLEAMPKKEGA